MAFDITIPFYAFQLHFSSGGKILTPLTDPGAYRMGQPLHLVAGQYAELLQRKVLNTGDLRSLLDEYRRGDFLAGEVEVVFPAARDGIRFPDFALSFDFFFTEQPNGFWGIVPALGLEGFGKNEQQLLERLEEAVRLDFIRQRRLQSVQDIVSAIWFSGVELNRTEIGLKTPSPRELEAREQSEQEKLLPKVARPLRLTQRVAYGRQKELSQFARALRSEFQRNVLLVGPSGVGKTALVWELARSLKKRRIEGRIWETTASTMIKELTRETGWQDNLAYLCRELASSKDILFVRNLMELFEVGQYEGNEVSLAAYLRTYLSRGEVNLITECTEEELARIELRSPNFRSLFQIIRLQEPPEAQLEELILKKVTDLAEHRQLTIAETAVREVIRLNRRFTPYAGMPGKPIRFIEGIVINKKAEKTTPATVDRSEVIRFFCEDTGMPRFMVDPAVPMDVGAVRRFFNENLFGQERAVNRVVEVLAAVKTALTRTGKPIASFLFVGPTGVGKTELAKLLAEFMFGNRERMTRFDMSEFSSPYEVMRLTGDSYFSDGLLTSAVRREPFCVLLFDEIEKADPNFFDLLLQMLSEGRLTDSQGKLVNFCSAIIIMTSNVGAEKLHNAPVSFQKTQQPETVSHHFLSAVQQFFRPELFNRIDEVIPFAPLRPESMRHVVDREVRQIVGREGIRFRRLDLQMETAVLDFLARKGYDARYGARQLQRVIREQFILALSKELNAQDPDEELVVRVGAKAETLHFQVETNPLGLELLLEELEKIQQADFTSRLRRDIYRLREGPLYVRLLSEIDILEGQKKSRGKKFWQNKPLAERYTRLLATREKTDAQVRQIEGYEMEMSMASLELTNYQPELVQHIKTWEDRLFQLKIELYDRLVPEAGHCILGIYGKNLESLFEFYRLLIEKREYQWNAKAVWFRDKYYHESIAVDESETEAHSPTPRKREKYLYSELPDGDLNDLRPPRKGDLLYGLELEVRGPAAFLFFREESGIQRWRLSEKTSETAAVLVGAADQETPANIHRRDFYTRESPRRTVDQATVKDSVYRINREYGRGQLAELIYEELESRFSQNLSAEVM